MTQKRKTIHLDFEKGVYQDLTKNLIPFEHGIYLAYTGNFNGKNVSLNKLLYIGMADDTTIAKRVHNHTIDDHTDWKLRYCKKGEDIYYLVAPLEDDIRYVEANMIFRYKPPCNTNDIDKYNGKLPAPNITTNTLLEDIDGHVTEMLRLM
ncbi:hypothetical protein [uncultured Duncaniella sp.]|uniref:hypothetical protein n=1 Tax=uncultured Duncaniella sp. TaxID=2768039 RepID=UPI0025B72480|nr:hypothetical protein [uncultured Duncaniella sp.]